MKTPGIKQIPVKFRWPIQQTDTNEVDVCIPVLPNAEPLIQVNENATIDLKLTEKETNKMMEAAENAAIKSILIIE